MNRSADSILVAALYRFVEFEDFARWQEPLRRRMLREQVRGTLLLAREGVNGTIAGRPDGVVRVLDLLRSDPRFAGLQAKESWCGEIPFRRTQVRLKNEIVTMGVDGIEPSRSAGIYVDPENWNAVVDDPEVTLIDSRNDYEVSIGSFRGAVDPRTATFREFPEFVAKHLDPQRHKKVAMFCTGGIRCEKSTAYLKQQGFGEVYHLRGGILKYLETVPEHDSRWEGECFVFDDRVSVRHALEIGDHVVCFACGWPVSPEGQQHPQFRAGVQCPHCADHLSERQRERFAERQRQWILSRQGGEPAVSPSPSPATAADSASATD